jgi:hypothetical protein
VLSIVHLLRQLLLTFLCPVALFLYRSLTLSCAPSLRMLLRTRLAETAAKNLVKNVDFEEWLALGRADEGGEAYSNALPWLAL